MKKTYQSLTGYLNRQFKGKRMKKIAMIGLGAIGQYVYKNLKKSKIEINSVICKENREEL